MKVKIKVCLWNTMPPCSNKVQKAHFSFKIKVKVTRLLTLVSFERASLVEYACQIWSVYLLLFKSYSKINVKVENRQTDKQTDRTKTICLYHSRFKSYGQGSHRYCLLKSPFATESHIDMTKTRFHSHFVPRAPVCEVSSRLYLFAYCLNPYKTMHFTRFHHCRNATY